jgi:hypothetical protein
MRGASRRAHTFHMLFRGMPGTGRALAPPGALVVVSIAAVVACFTFSAADLVDVVAVSALLFGLLQLVRGIHGLFIVRLRADSWLRSATGNFVPPAYAWRAAQLTSLEERRMLARSLRLVAERARERSRGGFGPRLIAARERRISLEALAKKLERGDEPVTPAGILRVTELITAGGGPLWGTSAEALGEAIERTLTVLAPCRS